MQLRRIYDLHNDFRIECLILNRWDRQTQAVVIVIWKNNLKPPRDFSESNDITNFATIFLYTIYGTIKINIVAIIMYCFIIL